MRYKQLAIYPVTLTLLVLTLIACGPADESVQRELGNLPPLPPLPHSKIAQPETNTHIAGAMTAPTNTPAPLLEESPENYPNTPEAQ